MKKIIALAVCALLGFYVAWPAWSAYKLAKALENKDAATLDSAVDFPSVRESLRPAVTSAIDARITKETASLGALGQALGGDLKSQMLPKLVEQVLSSVITPDNVIRIAHEGGDISASVERVLADAAGQMGAVAGGARSGGASSSKGGLGEMLGTVLGGSTVVGGGGGGDLTGLAGKILGGAQKPDSTPAAATSDTKSATKRRFGLGNIKGFSFAGPLSFNIAVARDAAQPKTDATLGMSFTGTGWKLSRIIPNL